MPQFKEPMTRQVFVVMFNIFIKTTKITHNCYIHKTDIWLCSWIHKNNCAWTQA